MRSFWAQPFSFTPWNFFVRLLLGLLAVRLGLWHRPREHRRLILSVMAFGFLSWVVAQWVLPLPTLPTDSPDGSIFGVFLKSLHEGFRLFRDAWLAFTYIGAVLLIVASGRLWERRLNLFAISGRMALTNYMIQIILIDVLFRPYGLGLRIWAVLIPLVALALFGALAAFSRWWLQRFRFGPAEWVLRSITYARLEPIRGPNNMPVAGSA